jgi:hypothetical protein
MPPQASSTPPKPASTTSVGKPLTKTEYDPKATNTDLIYYTHELKESLRYKKLGFSDGVPNDSNEAASLWNNTHTATLEDFHVSDKELLFPEARNLEGKYEEFVYFKGGERRPDFSFDALNDPSNLPSIKWNKI